jgi:ribonuclease P protein component
VAFAIGRAVGPAVVRNQLRRRLRAILSALPDDRSLASGWYLVGARPTAVERSFPQLSSDVEALIASVRLSSARANRATRANTRSHALTETTTGSAPVPTAESPS